MYFISYNKEEDCLKGLYGAGKYKPVDLYIGESPTTYNKMLSLVATDTKHGSSFGQNYGQVGFDSLYNLFILPSSRQ